MGTASVPFEWSTSMRESWETGRFGLNYAVKKGWAFDTIFWKYLGKCLFGDRKDGPKHDLWKTRVNLLSEEERRAMEPFVEWKLAQSKERILVDWDANAAREREAELLFG